MILIFLCLDLPSHQLPQPQFSPFQLSAHPINFHFGRFSPDPSNSNHTNYKTTLSWSLGLKKLAATECLHISVFYYARIICSCFLLCWSFFPLLFKLFVLFLFWVHLISCTRTGRFLLRFSFANSVSQHGVSTNHSLMGFQHPTYEQCRMNASSETGKMIRFFDLRVIKRNGFCVRFFIAWLPPD